MCFGLNLYRPVAVYIKAKQACTNADKKTSAQIGTRNSAATKTDVFLKEEKAVAY